MIPLHTTDHQFTSIWIGTINTVNAFLPLLKKGTMKRVITMSSPLGDYEFTLATGFAGATPYSISFVLFRALILRPNQLNRIPNTHVHRKAALNLAIAKFAAELGEEGFTIIALSPGMRFTSCLISSVTNPLSPRSCRHSKKYIPLFNSNLRL